MNRKDEDRTERKVLVAESTRSELQLSVNSIASSGRNICNSCCRFSFSAAREFVSREICVHWLLQFPVHYFRISLLDYISFYISRYYFRNIRLRTRLVTQTHTVMLQLRSTLHHCIFPIVLVVLLHPSYKVVRILSIA